jgi:hypothetical protein
MQFSLNVSKIESWLNSGKLCNEDEIKSWTSHKEIDDQKRLTKEGEDELFAIAERMQLRFPNLLNQPYENTNFLVKYLYYPTIIYFVTFY